jgi:hypothetical protein
VKEDGEDSVSVEGELQWCWKFATCGATCAEGSDGLPYCTSLNQGGDADCPEGCIRDASCQNGANNPCKKEVEEETRVPVEDPF